MRIIAYTYDADVHCPACALSAYKAGTLRFDSRAATAMAGSRDEHGLPMTLQDRERNPVHPVFATDEHDFTHCGDCRATL